MVPEAFLNDIKKIKQQRIKNANNTIIGHLNMNSFSNKFVFALGGDRGGGIDQIKMSFFV